LRYLIVILICCLNKGFSQLGPPALRCLQVTNNGDVNLIWVPPADPSGIFFEYEIYFSTALNGPYALIASPAVRTNTNFLHVGAMANVQSRFYYMLTKSGTAGNGVSRHSDTLRTIFLDILSIPDCISLTYNDLHQPKLPTTSNSFSILKEYPIGIWGTFASTDKPVYNDTLSICQTSLNYQVRLLDGSGCVSSSNYVGGIYTDTHKPNEPLIDSISVLPNGDVILAWQVPYDKDVVRYIIYKLSVTPTNTINAVIDTVNGRSSTNYTLLTSNSNSGSVSIFVSALDSCQNPKISTFNNFGGTIFLKTQYDRCNYKTTLNWNAYKNMRKGLGQYKIYYSPDATNFTVVGTTTNTSFVHEKVDPDRNVCYYIRAVNSDASITSSSNKACFFSTQVIAPAYLYIRSAGISSESSAQLRLFLDSTKYSKGMEIYRSTDGLDYKQVGFVPTNSFANYVFIDQGALMTNKTSYFYKASIRDSCGNTRTVSNVSKTILLNVKDDKEFFFTKYLSWSNYLGYGGGVSSYNVYRVINGVVNPQPIGNSGQFSTQYTDNLENEAPNGSRVEYMVEAIEGNSNPFGFIEKSRSNSKPVYMEGRIFVPEAFAPNGRNRIWKPVSHFIDKSEYTVRVFNRWGNKIFETNDDTVGWDGDGSEPGIYIYIISYKNSRGEYQEIKGNFLLL
jgi:gliding motility-associated-like protein